MIIKAGGDGFTIGSSTETTVFKLVYLDGKLLHYINNILWSVQTISLTGPAYFRVADDNSAGSVQATVRALASTEVADIMDSIHNIPAGAFEDNINLTQYDFTYTTSIGANAFKGTGLMNVVIPNLSSMGEGAFTNASSITSISISGDITVIPANALNTGALKTVQLPNTITTLGVNALAFTDLSVFSMPSSLVSVGDGAFAVSSGATHIILPATVASFGMNVFSQNPDLLFVEFEGAKPTALDGSPLVLFFSGNTINTVYYKTEYSSSWEGTTATLDGQALSVREVPSSVPGSISLHVEVIPDSFVLDAEVDVSGGNYTQLTLYVYDINDAYVPVLILPLNYSDEGHWDSINIRPDLYAEIATNGVYYIRAQATNAAGSGPMYPPEGSFQTMPYRMLPIDYVPPVPTVVSDSSGVHLTVADLAEGITSNQYQKFGYMLYAVYGSVEALVLDLSNGTAVDHTVQLANLFPGTTTYVAKSIFNGAESAASLSVSATNSSTPAEPSAGMTTAIASLINASDSDASRADVKSAILNTIGLTVKPVATLTLDMNKLIDSNPSAPQWFTDSISNLTTTIIACKPDETITLAGSDIPEGTLYFPQATGSSFTLKIDGTNYEITLGSDSITVNGETTTLYNGTFVPVEIGGKTYGMIASGSAWALQIVEPVVDPDLSDPSQTTITPAETSVVVSWSAIANSSVVPGQTNEASYYTLAISSTGPFQPIEISTSLLTYPFSGLTPNTTYTLVLRSANGAGLSKSGGSSVNFTTTGGGSAPISPPTAPTVVSGPTATSATEATVVFDACGGASPPTQYDLYVYLTDNAFVGQFIDTTGSGSITMTGLTVGTDYKLQANATNAAGAGAGTEFIIYTHTYGGGGGGVPCFLGDAPVRTPTGYQRIDSLKEGDMVLTGDGRAVAVQRVKRTLVAAGPTVNPYVIPRGRFGAEKRLLISPNHRVQVEGRGLVEARELGLRQEEKSGQFVYYNLELPEWGRDTMVVAGVVVESLAPVRRVAMSMGAFKALLAKKYGAAAATPEILQKVLRACRLLPDGRVEAPVMRNT